MPHLGHTSQKSLATPLFYVPLCYYNSIHHLHQYKYIKKQNEFLQVSFRNNLLLPHALHMTADCEFWTDILQVGGGNMYLKVQNDI